MKDFQVDDVAAEADVKLAAEHSGLTCREYVTCESLKRCERGAKKMKSLWDVLRSLKVYAIRVDDKLKTVAPAEGVQRIFREVLDAENRYGDRGKFKIATLGDKASLFVTFRDWGTASKEWRRTQECGFRKAGGLDEAGPGWTSLVVFHDLDLHPVNTLFTIVTDVRGSLALEAAGVVLSKQAQDQVLKVDEKPRPDGQPWWPRVTCAVDLERSKLPLFAAAEPNAWYVELKRRLDRKQHVLAEARKALSKARTQIKKSVGGEPSALVTLMGRWTAAIVFPKLVHVAGRRFEWTPPQTAPALAVEVPYSAFCFELQPPTKLPATNFESKIRRLGWYQFGKVAQLVLWTEKLAAEVAKLAARVSAFEYGFLTNGRRFRWDLQDRKGNDVTVLLRINPDRVYTCYAERREAQAFQARVPGTVVRPKR